MAGARVKAGLLGGAEGPGRRVAGRNLAGGNPRLRALERHEAFKSDLSMSTEDSTHSPFGASKTAADLLVQESGRYFEINACFRGVRLTGPDRAAPSRAARFPRVPHRMVRGRYAVRFGRDERYHRTRVSCGW